MMEMNGQDSTKCRKSKLGDIDDIIEFVLNDNKTKLCIVSSPTIEIRSQKRGKGKMIQWVNYFDFRVRR